MASKDAKACNPNEELFDNLNRTYFRALEELMVSTLATTDALIKLLIEKGVITQAELLEKVASEQAVYQRLLKPTPQ